MKSSQKSKKQFTTVGSNLNPLKKSIKKMNEEIFYSQEEKQSIKQEQAQIFKNEDSKTSFVNNLKLQQSRDWFLNFEKSEKSDKDVLTKELEDDQQYRLTEASESINEKLEDYTYESDCLNQQRKDNSTKRQFGRKIRTTITKEKLQQMNRIFKEYHENKEDGNNKISINLREIGIKLQLGYSTILHKYKEFKQNKSVKGGFLLENCDSKRKYKKSLSIQMHIKQALDKVQLSNAVEISKYIHKTRKIYYSRAVICRHLLSMNEQQEYFTQFKQKGCIGPQNSLPKEVKASQSTFEEILQKEKKKGNIIYCHEVVFSTEALPLGIKTYEDISNFNRTKRTDNAQISLIIAVNQNKVLCSQVKNGFFLRQQYLNVIQKIGKLIATKVANKKDKILLATNFNQIYYEAPTFENNFLSENNERSLKAILDRYNLRKAILSSQYLQVSPLMDLFSRIKQQLNEQPMQKQHLTAVVQRELKEWAIKEHNFSF